MSITLFLIAAWIWCCLVMCSHNHMRNALFGIPIVVVLVVTGVLHHYAEKFAEFVRDFGHDDWE